MKIFVIAYYFPPCRAVGSIRYENFFHYLREIGHEVTVLTASWSDDNTEEPGIVRLGRNQNFSGTETIRKSRFGLMGDFLSHPSQYIRSVDKSMFAEWYKLAKKWVKENRDFIIKHDIVLSTYKPMSDILLANLIKKLYKLPILIDQRDLIAICALKKRLPVINSIDKIVDRFLMRKADAVMVVTPTLQRRAEAFYKKKVYLVTNGYREIPAQTGSENDNGDLKIVYTGTICDTRDPKLIAEFINEYNKTHQKKVYLEMASSQDPFELIGHSCDYVKWHGYLGKEKVEELQKSASICLMLEDMNEDGIENLPAKIYEYMSRLKPIMAMCHPLSDMGEILAKTCMGSIVTDYKEFCSFIDNFDKINPDLGAIKGFWHGNLVYKLESALKEVISNKS